MPVKKAKSKSKSKKSSDMVVAGYTRSSGAYGRYQPSGSELKWFDVNQPNAVLGFGLATLIQALNIVPSGTGPNQRIGRTIIIKELEVKVNYSCLWTYPAATAPNAAGVSYRVDLILDKQANGAVPVGADIYDTLIAGVSPENRFMNLLNSDRFTLLKRWEGDINPPSFIDASATATQLVVGRDLKVKKRCNIRVELTPAPVPTIADVRSNNLLLVFSASNQNAGGAIGVSVVNTSDTRIRFQDA